MGLGFRKDEDAKGKEKRNVFFLNNQPDIRILARPVRADGDSRTGKSGTRHILKNTKNKAIPCPREKDVLIAMNAALEDVYKKVFADSYQHGAPLSRGA